MTEAIINTWLESVKIDLTKNYNNLGLKASGNWPKQLETFNNTKPESLSIGILGEDYTNQLENGRRPNKKQSKKSLKAWVGWAGSTFLKQWVKNKKINISPYAVAWKIAREGWSVPNKFNEGGLVSDVVTKERIEDLNRELLLFYVEGFKSDIIKVLK